MIPWIMISIGVLLVALGIFFLVAVKKGKKKHETDYYTFFILGICWLPLGIATDNYTFSAMGLVFMIWGLANKDKWKKNHRSWKDLNQRERNLKLWTIIGLLVLIFLGIVVFFLTGR